MLFTPLFFHSYSDLIFWWHYLDLRQSKPNSPDINYSKGKSIYLNDLKASTILNIRLCPKQLGHYGLHCSSKLDALANLQICGRDVRI